MKIYITNSTKSEPIQQLINEALDILESVGIPLYGKSQRGLERMAICFLAVAGITNDWKEAKSLDDNIHLKTRDIINIINANFEEHISPGSYDDIRRKDLKLLVLADLILNSGVNKGSATNDPTRGYALHPDFRALIINYNTDSWLHSLKIFSKNKVNLSDILARKRLIDKIPILLPNGISIDLSLGEHNILQKEIIDQFLPRFGNDCEVLYIGDTTKKMLYKEETTLNQLNFFELLHDELPDIIAYSKNKNWLYLIEAVHSSGPMSELRVFELKKMLDACKAGIVFVTAFLKKSDFRKWMLDIAWETEVWIADNPDHLIHFNGHKFLGPM